MAALRDQQPTHKAEILDLIRWIDDNSEQGIDAFGNRVPFMPQNTLKQYLSQKNRLRDLLKALFDPEDLPVYVSPTSILAKCISVFVILVRIRKGKYIQEFLRHRELFDHQLPFRTRPLDFPSSSNDEPFFDDFCKEQWRFCAHTFSDGEDNIRISEPCILPILTKESLEEGGTADLFKVTLHADYDKLQSTLEDVERLSTFGKPPKTYVLKTFRSKRYAAEELYRAESEAFYHLRNSHALGKHFIGFYGSFTHGDTRNILLEYADCGSLENYFDTVEPPSTGKDTIKLWKSMFEVLKAVDNIHTIQPLETPDAAPVFNGYVTSTLSTTLADYLGSWHQDIKPDNILVARGSVDGDFEFKLADLGLAHFRRIKARRQGGHQASISDKDAGGTREYGAPECYRGDEFQHRTTRNIGQAVDIWSLGCVFSEFAQWIAQGKKGLYQYRTSRRAFIARHIPSHQDPGCFHDKQKVLKIVKDTHEELFTHVRVDDVMMKPVIKKMVEEMLYEGRGRPTASQLCYKAQEIVEQAEKELLQCQQPRKLSRSSTTQSSELKSDRILPRRPSYPKRTEVYSAPAPALSGSSSYGDRSHPMWTVDAAELRSDVSKNDIRRDESRRAALGKNTAPLDPPGETLSRPRRTSHGRREGSVTGPSSPPASVPTTPSNSSDNNEQLPNMTISQALFYIICNKDGRGDLVPREARGYLNELDKRDHVFLIDDAASMQQHWLKVQMVTRICAYFLKRYDDNGMDVYFASSREGMNSKNVTPLMTRIAGHPARGTSDIGSRLGNLVTEYINKIEGRHPKSFIHLFNDKPPKNLNVYVLTDGIWQSTSDAKTPIKRLVAMLGRQNRDSAQVGIQFIFFGDNQQAREKLERLDDDLGLEMDIVDMEPADGNVLKMLTGAILKNFDRTVTNGLSP
ncbi:hypothetical protein LTR46_001431 [Exophiala xenobiotica]|nr:hypothetical protein LTR46_001431 [Exophiala xenobiotica]